MRYVMTSDNVAPFAIASLADMLVGSTNCAQFAKLALPAFSETGGLIVITAYRAFDIASFVRSCLAPRPILEHSRRRLPNTQFTKHP